MAKDWKQSFNWELVKHVYLYTTECSGTYKKAETTLCALI